jgi:hypothetical protein
MVREPVCLLSSMGFSIHKNELNSSRLHRGVGVGVQGLESGASVPGESSALSAEESSRQDHPRTLDTAQLVGQHLHQAILTGLGQNSSMSSSMKNT